MMPTDESKRQPPPPVDQKSPGVGHGEENGAALEEVFSGVGEGNSLGIRVVPAGEQSPEPSSSMPAGEQNPESSSSIPAALNATLEGPKSSEERGDSTLVPSDETGKGATETVEKPSKSQSSPALYGPSGEGGNSGSTNSAAPEPPSQISTSPNRVYTASEPPKQTSGLSFIPAKHNLIPKPSWASIRSNASATVGGAVGTSTVATAAVSPRAGVIPKPSWASLHSVASNGGPSLLPKPSWASLNGVGSSGNGGGTKILLPKPSWASLNGAGDIGAGKAANLLPKPSWASLGSSSGVGVGGGAISAKPSMVSIDSTRGLVGSAAPMAGHQNVSVAAKPSLADLPESPRSPAQTPAQTWPASLGGGAPAVSGAEAKDVSDDEKKAGGGSSGSGGGPSKGPQAGSWNDGKPLAKIDLFKKKWGTYLRIFGFTTWKERVALGCTVLCAAACGAVLPFMNVVFGRLVTEVSKYYTTGMTQEQISKDFEKQIRECVLYMVYLFIGRFILSYFAHLGFRNISLRISATMRLEYMRAVLHQPISALDALPSGRISAIVTNTANNMQLGIGEKLGAFITSISLLTSALIIAYVHHWKLSLVTSSGLFLIAGAYAFTMPQTVKIMKTVEESEIYAGGVAGEAFYGVRMVAACGAEEINGRRYDLWVRETRTRGNRLCKFQAIQQAIIHFTTYGTFALSFWYGIRLYLRGDVTSIGTLIIVLMSVMMIVTSISGIATPLNAAARASTAATNLFAMIDAPSRETSGQKEPEVSADGDIAMMNVNFAYPGRADVKVLQGLNIKFPAGKITAIVGPSGSGKSTIVGLIERWYELDGDWTSNLKTFLLRNGRVTCGGKDVKSMDLKWWRSQIGLVQQEPFLFNDTIRQNIEHGLIGTRWEHATPRTRRKLVERACKEAFADEFIQRLPDGLDTQVGDQGIKLSGGQRQRIAIARAIIKRPKILILDEATAAIDVKGEQMVQAALDRVSRGRTTITIAHRLSTIKKAHNIVVLAKGKAVQQGTHDALMAQVGGAYWTLATAQQLSLDQADELESPGVSGEKQRSMDIMDSEESGSSGDEIKENDYQDRGFLTSFGALIAEQGRRWPWYSMFLFGALIAGACTPIHAYLFAALITSFSFFGSDLDEWVRFWCLMVTALAGAAAVGYFSLAWSATTLAFKITATYRKEYFRNLISKPIPWHDQEGHSAGALTAMVTTDPAQLQQMLGMNMGFTLISILSVTGCLIISFFFGWKLTLVALASSLPIILTAGFLRMRHERSLEQKNRLVFAESAKFASEAVGSCRTVTALTMEDSILERYERLLNKHLEKAWSKSKWATLAIALSDSVQLLCMAFVLWYGAKLLARGEYYPFQYLVVYIAVLQGGAGAGQWLSFGPNIAQATAAANRILASRIDPKMPRRKMGPPKELQPMDDDEKGVSIDFNNVWFRYPTRDAPVLNGLDLKIEKGQFVAIVGASGAGKTSIISLLERFYTVKAGSITYNGVDVNSIPLQEYRNSIALVAQQANLFSGTIRENILAGIDASSVTEEDIHKACEEAEIHEFIVSLPEGYDTTVGLRGVAMSGGQRQRIAIARALIRKPKLLLLDEATSALDSETERSVQQVFERTKGERTMVWVAHRLATVQNADVIYVLSDGQVVESGTHAALLGKRGAYYHMCLAQALDR